MKLLTSISLLTASVFIIGCGGGSTKVENAKEILTSNKWYFSIACEEDLDDRSSEVKFYSDKVVSKNYFDTKFEDYDDTDTDKIKYTKKGFDIYDNGKKDTECLVSSDSTKKWVSIQCIDLEDDDTSIEIPLYKTKAEAIKNNKELCQD
jgi:hypothetical protein